MLIGTVHWWTHHQAWACYKLSSLPWCWRCKRRELEEGTSLKSKQRKASNNPMIVIKRGGRRFGPVCTYWSADALHCDMPPPSHPICPLHCNITNSSPLSSRRHFEAQPWPPYGLSLSTRPLSSLLLGPVAYRACSCSLCISSNVAAATMMFLEQPLVKEWITNLSCLDAWPLWVHVCFQFTALRFWVDVGS